MTFSYIIEQAGIPLLLFAMCMYYAWRVMTKGDMTALRGRNEKPVKLPEAYAQEAGRLLIFFGLASLAMAIISLFNVLIAFIEIVVCTVILIVLWKRMNKKYE